MSNVKSGQVWTGLIVTRDGNGALSAATTGPAGTLYVNGTSDAASVTITGSNPYKYSVTLPTLTAGDTVSMYITATVAGVATASVVAQAIGDTKRLSDTLAANPATGGIVAASFGAGAIDAAALAADAGTEIAAAVRANLTTELAAIILARKVLQNRTETDPATGIMTIYDDDGTTPLYTANLYTDVAGSAAYDGTAGVNRRNALA